MEIPDSHADLLEGAGIATFSTLAKDGSIQSSLVWFDFLDGRIRINTTDDTAKAKNVARDPRATLLVFGEDGGKRYLTLRLRLERIERAGALEHLDHVTRENTGVAHWYGGMMPVDEAEMARRVVLMLAPERVFAFQG